MTLGYAGHDSRRPTVGQVSKHPTTRRLPGDPMPRVGPDMTTPDRWTTSLLSDDELAWQIAGDVQLTRTEEDLHRYLGRVTARPHPTGWFISARCRTDLSPQETAELREVVVLRTYLLLTRGPQPGVWERAADGSFVAHPGTRLEEMDPAGLIPDTVPAGWS